MTKFCNSSLEVNEFYGNSIEIIPKEYLEVHARLSWEKAGRPEGKSLEFWLEAEIFFGNYVVVPTDVYKLIDDKI